MLTMKPVSHFLFSVAILAISLYNTEYPLTKENTI